MNRIVEITLQSGLLILAVLAARVLVRNHVSARAVYALWLAPALRLLLPVSVSSRLSIMNLLAAPGEAVNAAGTAVDSTASAAVSTAAPAMLAPAAETVAPVAQSAVPADIPATAAVQLSTADILMIVWLAGAVLVLGYLVAVNMRYLRALMKNARAIDVDAVLPKRTRVYVSPIAASPCVWGLWRRRIVLTTQCVDDKRMTAYALEHEIAHIRQRDTLIALVRMLLCAAYWFHPLVWLAAKLSRDDGELACDARVTDGMSCDERLAYGHVLVGLLAHTTVRPPFGSTSTTMRGGSNMKKRIQCIAHQRKSSKAAAVILAVMMIAVMLIACTTAEEGVSETLPTTTPTGTFSVATDDGHVDTPEEVMQTASEYTTIVRDYTSGYMPTMSSIRGLPIGFTMDSINTVTLSCQHGALISEQNNYEGARSITFTGADIASITDDEMRWPVYWVPFNTAGTVENIQSDVISVEATDIDGNKYHQTLCVLLDNSRYTMFDMPDADNAVLSTPAAIIMKKDDTMTVIEPADPYYEALASFASQRITAVDRAERPSMDVINEEVEEWKQTYDWVELYYPEKYLAGEFIGTGDSRMELMAHTRLLMFLTGEYADLMFPYNEYEACYVTPVYIGRTGTVPDVGFDDSVQSTAEQENLNVTMYAYTAEVGGVRYICVRVALKNTGTDDMTLGTAPYITLNVAKDGVPMADSIGEQLTSYRGEITSGDTLDAAIASVIAREGGTYTLGGQYGDIVFPDLEITLD